jgi:hypothetical protein
VNQREFEELLEQPRIRSPIILIRAELVDLFTDKLLRNWFDVVYETARAVGSALRSKERFLHSGKLGRLKKRSTIGCVS